MTGYERICELKKKREEYVRVSQENNMYEGTKKILTDMYPDTAHFIYELLQNAEDMCATNVKFVLYYDRLIFEHNGTKRDFVIEDIDSITSIGNNSLKRDDKTSIGKFGVGFKAVYTYTSTPEIHSGEFDFKIKDMFIPDPEGVEKRAKPGLTQFVFPFDHKTKNSVVANKEIKEGLLQLDENSVLFLNNIKQIVFILPDGKKGGVKLFDKTEVNKTIVHLDPFTGTKSKTYWAKFSKNCTIKVEGEEKDYPVSIAYKLDKVDEIDDKPVFKIDSNLHGNVCIYFPAVKEQSHLRFHINAPFASTVARDSVRDCAENRTLINEIAKLTVSSLYYFKSENMVDLSLYATLPSSKDFDDDSVYEVIYNAVINEFKNAELIVTEGKEYKKISEVFQTNREIAKLINREALHKLYKKYWLPAVNPQTRELYFLLDLGIKTFDRRNIAEALRYNPKCFDSLYIEKSNEWFRDWFALLCDTQNIYLYSNSFKNVKMIKCVDGQCYRATDKIYLKNNLYDPKNIKDPIYVDLPTTSYSADEKAKKFLEIIGLQTMSEKIDILSDIKKNGAESEDVVLVALNLIEKYKNNEDISLFANEAVFLATKIVIDDVLDKNVTYRVKANECCWDERVAFFFKYFSNIKFVLDKEKYGALNEQEWEIFKELFHQLGGKIRPYIYKCQITDRHPQYKQLKPGRFTANGVNEDYTLTGLARIKEISQKELFKESLLLWNTMVSDKNYNHHKAIYQANRTADEQVFESTLAYYLKRTNWIPNKEGCFCRPCDIKKDELFEGFVYNEDAVFLKLIGFGDSSQAPNDVFTILNKAGYNLSNEDAQWLNMSEDKKKRFFEFLALEETQEKEKLTFTEALAQSEKEQSELTDEDDDYGRDISDKNPSKRAEKLQKEFEEGLQNTPAKSKVWKYAYEQKGNGPEKQFVKEEYKGKCQICGRDAIVKYNGQKYFEAINIINTNLLKDVYLNNLETGWNTLCLCPNCAAEYRYCAKNLNELEKQVEEIVVESRKNEMIDINISLKGQNTKIHFTPKHVIALKAAFKIFKEHEQNN